MYNINNNIAQRTVESTAILCIAKGKPDCASLLNKMKKIKLTQGKVCLVDDEDFEWLNQFNWNASQCNKKYFYAKRKENNKGIKMHRFILGITDPNILVDHKDGNTLNNQRDNLRIATKSQNGINRKTFSNNTGVRGVYLHKSSGAYVSVIQKDKVKYYLGKFPLTKQGKADAELAYDRKAKELYGEFYNPNTK